MKKFIIEETIPARVILTYEVEAENEETALEMVMNGDVEVEDISTQHMYESSATIEFTRKVVEEKDM